MPYAAVAGAAVSGGLGLVGSAMQSSAVSEASDKATQAELQMYQQTRSDLSPYTTAGYGSITQQQNLLGLNGQDAADAAMATFQSSPSYNYLMSEGLRGIDAGAASTGMLRSGATLKAEEKYASNLADLDFSDYYTRLAGLTTTGANAAGGQATANTSTANQLSSIATGEGNALSSIYGNTTSGLSSTINSLFKNLGTEGVFSSGSGSGSGNLSSWVKSTQNDPSYQGVTY